MRFSIIIATVFISITIGLVPHTMAAEEVYRWVDENGVVHFGDRAPDQGNAEKVSVKPSSGAESSPASPNAEQTVDPQPSYAQQLRDARAEKRAETEENEKMIAEACKQRRTLVSQLEPSTRVMVRLEDGTVTRMDDNIRLETLNEAKTYIANNCEK